jgi:dTDP-D-glucose 4,6-dehydratase
MGQFDADKLPKLLAYLNSPAGRRVRTNNHVERTNRRFRFLEKVRYKWRRRRTLVRFVVLKLDEVWGDLSSPKAAMSKPEPSSGYRRTQPDEGQPARPAA